MMENIIIISLEMFIFIYDPYASVRLPQATDYELLRKLLLSSSQLGID